MSGGKYSGERYDPALESCSTLTLAFDGTTLKMTGGSKTYTYLAVSGMRGPDGRFNDSRAAQRASFSGPFPANYQRGGFFIHGGKVPGSAGCIDLTSNIETLVDDFDKEGARRKCQIRLTVKYPQAGQ